MRAAAFLLPALLLTAALAAPLPTARADGDAEIVARALDFLAATQRGDGSFAQPGVLGETVAAAGLDPKTWPSPDASLFSAMRPYAGASDLYAYERLASAAGAAGYDPRDVNGLDLVALVREQFDGTQFGSAEYLNDDVWAILALRAAGVPADDPQVQAAASYVAARQNHDGGWGYAAGSATSGTDMTGMMLAALRAAGRDMTPFVAARVFLDSTYREAEGGHTGVPGLAGGANCQSTAWAVHGYAAFGVEPRAKTLDYLRSLEKAGTGGFRISKGGPVNDFCTMEAALVLSGARFPLRGFAPAMVDAPDVRVGSPARFRVLGAFDEVKWTLPDGEGRGWSQTRTLAPGTHAYAVEASGPQGRFRHHGTLQVYPEAPRPTVPPALETLRGEPIVVDGSSWAYDGRILSLRVEWGDGNATEAARSASHAYARPGEYTLRTIARDGLGASEPATVHVTVRNRAPVFSSLPALLVADRLAPLSLARNATDPDGDAVTLHWRLGDAEGEGAVPVAALAPGRHALELRAADSYGGNATVRLSLEIVNLPPEMGPLRLPESARPGLPFAFSVEAKDVDGPEPSVSWRFGSHTVDGTAGEVSLPEGTHEVVAIATDMDGGIRERRATLVVAAEPQLRTPADVRNLSARLANGTLHVSFDASPPDTPASLRWTSDAGDGEQTVPAGVHELSLPNATWARVMVVVERDGERASQEVGPVRAPPVPLAPPAVPSDPIVAAPGEAARIALMLVEGASGYQATYGDGHVSAWLDAPLFEHVYEQSGSYEARITARAPDGRTASASVVVRVHAPAVEREPEEAPVDDAPATEEPAPLAPVASQQLPIMGAGSEPRREVPAPAAPLALLAAALLLARLGRRGPSA